MPWMFLEFACNTTVTEGTKFRCRLQRALGALAPIATSEGITISIGLDIPVVNEAEKPEFAFADVVAMKIDGGWHYIGDGRQAEECLRV